MNSPANFPKKRQAKERLDAIRQRLYIVIYGTNTKAGKAFDIALLVLILLSVLVIMMESIQGVDLKYHRELIVLEWIFSILFTIEYLLRIFISRKPFKYIFSFYGIIDLLSILPMYVALFITGSHILSTLRILRLLRLFRVFRLMEFMQESSKLRVALMASRAKILVFLYTVMIIAVLIGTLMYYIEGPENGFTSIPQSVYYTIVTLTTVGYGDIVPSTRLGQFLSMILMVTGYGIIAVPTGIVGVAIAKGAGTVSSSDIPNSYEDEHSILNQMACGHCGAEEHRADADYCFRCGQNLSL